MWAAQRAVRRVAMQRYSCKYRMTISLGSGTRPSCVRVRWGRRAGTGKVEVEDEDVGRQVELTCEGRLLHCATRTLLFWLNDANLARSAGNTRFTSHRYLIEPTATSPLQTAPYRISGTADAAGLPPQSRRGDWTTGDAANSIALNTPSLAPLHLLYTVKMSQYTSMAFLRKTILTTGLRFDAYNLGTCLSAENVLLARDMQPLSAFPLDLSEG